MAEEAKPGYASAQVAAALQAFEMLASMAVFPSAQLPEVAGQQAVTATIGYSGAFNGNLRFECAPEVAYIFTERAMGVDHPDGVTDEVRDAVGELLNTIAGGLKSRLPAYTRIHMPEVSADIFVRDGDAGDESISRLDFDSEFGPFRLMLFESRAVGV